MKTVGVLVLEVAGYSIVLEMNIKLLADVWDTFAIVQKGPCSDFNIAGA